MSNPKNRKDVYVVVRVEVESPLKAQELLAQVEAQIDIDDITIGEMPVREIEVCSVHNEQP